MKILLRALALAGSFVAAAFAAVAPTPERITALRTELEAMHTTDQAQRQEMAATGRLHGQNSPQMAELWKKQSASDAKNIARLEEIIGEIGWPKLSDVGGRAASAAFLILQHSDLSYQKKYLPLARAAVAEKEMHGSSLALLEDRILIREGGKQIYGSQVQRNAAGQWEALPLEDPANVDQRRAAVGLPPLADYLAGFASREGGQVNDPARDRPRAGAPALKQTLFAATDDARAAYEKLRALLQRPEPVSLDFQVACREFCDRFPESASYGPVRVLALRAWARLRPPEQKAPEVWDQADIAKDPKVGPEQQAEAAVILSGNALRSGPPPAGASGEELAFNAALTALQPYLGTRYAKDWLLRTSVDLPPDRVIPVLRKTFPDDPAVAAAIGALEQVGRPLEFTFTALDGKAVDLRDYRGKVVLLACWAGGDAPASISSRLVAGVRELADRHPAADLAVIGISFDRNRASAEKFVREQKLAWPVYCDERGWNNAFAERMVIKSLPTYLLVDRRGVLRFRGKQLTGTTTTSRLAALIAEGK